MGLLIDILVAYLIVSSILSLIVAAGAVYIYIRKLGAGHECTDL